jgi:hypothetical protein
MTYNNIPTCNVQSKHKKITILLFSINSCICYKLNLAVSLTIVVLLISRET